MQKLPLFPLHTVLFPGMPIHLNIFEQRYRLMLQQCIRKNLPFGVTLIKQGSESLGPLATPHLVGCTARILHLEPLADGRINLTAIGDERFRIHSLDENNPYLVGEVEFMEFNNNNIDFSTEVNELKPWVEHYMAQLTKLEDDRLTFGEIKLSGDPLRFLFTSAALLQIPPIEKQSILAMTSLIALFENIKRLYRRETAMLDYQISFNNKDANRVAIQN